MATLTTTVVDSHGVRRKDTTKGPPLRILSLDGGGVRGYSMLIILQELMHRTFVEIEGRAPRRHEIPKPCDHFDLIVGTGTGGLIALMLGRLRLSVETCKDVYVRMTKRVFETDKTIAGIPYRSTLFKASKLEDAIKDCVREHTIYFDEGNDEDDADAAPDSPGSTISPLPPSRPMRSASISSRYSQIGASYTTVDLRRSRETQYSNPVSSRWGNPNALLYDNRETRTKTAVTAVYKGSRKGNPPALLRSYDSRKETAAEQRCTIWQAGRGTCATQLAFKPIQVGQSVFLDEGAGRYNPSPLALDEAVQNEWPGREVAVFVSVGTGKRPPGTNNQQHLWWEGYVSNGISDFAEARRRLIAKIEGCEDTHQDMVHGRLAERGVNVENYYRLNVEVGVGEFGMNEWNRLAEISTSTRMYLAQSHIQSMNISAATKLARVHRHNLRWNRAIQQGEIPDPKYPRHSWEYNDSAEPEPPTVPGAIELPAAEVSGQVHFADTVQVHHDHQQRPYSPASQAPIPVPIRPAPNVPVIHKNDDKFIVMAPTPDEYQRSSMDQSRTPRRSHDQVRNPVISVTPPPAPSYTAPPPSQSQAHDSPPPVPPKTPLSRHSKPVQGYPPPTSAAPPVPSGHYPSRPSSSGLPYPDMDGPPPINKARKPEYGARQ